jgi:[protein-PII] uridylyltransferase
METVVSTPDESGSLRLRVQDARRASATDLSSGMPGLAIARKLAATVRALVVERFDAAFRAAPVPGAALIALGGFGRQELGPFSDVDLLLLVPEGSSAATLAHETFTPLWDAALEPGTALRTASEAIAFTVEDHTAATALLDARPLAGDPAAAQALLASFWEHLHGDRLEAFIAAKVKEVEERRARFGGSVYLLEPNVKTGVGGLRDLAGGLWVARARHRLRGLSGVAHRALLPRREIEAVRNARDTLWRMRCQLHLQARRRDDRLTFSAQEQLAQTLGYGDTAESLGVELLMRDYYLAAHTIEHATDAMIDRCVSESRIRRSYQPAVAVTADLEIFDGRLTFREPADPAARRELLVELFVTAERERIPVLSSARDRVAHEVTLCGAALATDTEALRAFYKYIVSPGATGQALRGLYETGVIGGLFPDFARLKSRVQHDVYHVYTVDTHTLFAVQKMLRLRAGLMAADAPVFTRLCQDVARPLPLYLGLFFHDLGKHMGGSHAVRGEELVRAWGKRVGIDVATVEDAAFLVREHLTLSTVAFRRDLSDMALVTDLVAKLGSRERLDMLYLLTYVDISSVGPETWNDWRSRLLAELYEKCRIMFDEQGDDSRPRTRTEAAEEGASTLRAMLHTQDPMLERFLGILPERYLATVAPASGRAHFELWKSAQGRAVAGTSILRPDVGEAGEFVVVADDRPGMLALIAGTLAAHSIDILGAEIFSLKDGRVLDSFLVREPGHQPPSHKRMAGVLSDLELVMSGRETVPALLARRRGNGRLFTPGPAVPTRIRVDMTAARDATVVDVYAQDHVGLLHDLADACHRAGASIVLARIATEGNCATDGFYLQDLTGHKIVDQKHLQRLETTLREAVHAE